MHLKPLLCTLVTVVPALLAPAASHAVEIPDIGGHLTDPGHKVEDSAKDAVEDRLGKIQDDTHIDVAAWITDVPADKAAAAGREAYDKWGIGKDWDSGLLLVFPKSGPVEVVQNADKPELNADEAKKLVAADKPSDEMPKRLDALAGAVTEILTPKVPKRPPVLSVPDITGHLNDPTGKLNDEARNSLDERLGRIQESTHIDVVVWVTGMPEDRVSAMATEAFHNWNVGGEWDNGLLMALPATGRIRIVENPANPILNPVEEAQLAAADNPGEADLQKRLEHVIDTARTLVVPKVSKSAPAAHETDHSGVLLAGAAVVLIGFGFWFSRKKA